MTITQLRYFLDAVKCGSLKKAAEKNFISHQALSKQMRALEKELDTSLFDRKKRILSLTDAGEILYNAWDEIIHKHDFALSQVLQLKKQDNDRVLIGIQDTRQLRYKCMELFQAYADSYQDFSIDYKIGSPDHLLAMLDNKQVDMVITQTLSLEDVDRYSHLLLQKVEDRPVLAISNRNPLSKQKNLTLKDLSNETFVLIDASYSHVIAKRQEKDFASYGFSPKIITVSNPNELELALALNHGIGLVHEMLLTGIKDKITMFPFDPADGNKEFETVLLWNNKSFDKAANELLIVSSDVF